MTPSALRHLLAAACFSLLLGCATSIQYSVQPDRVADPGESFDRLVRQHWEYSTVKVEYGQRYVTLRWVVDEQSSGQRLLSKTVMYDQIRSIRIYSWRGRFGVGAYDADGSERFSMFVPTLDAAQELADTLAALGRAKPSSQKREADLQSF